LPSPARFICAHPYHTVALKITADNGSRKRNA
jgi:hypothetical protein